jgi:hypothetical protein
VASAYRILHEAFNEAAGRAIFSAQRERFLAEHAHLAAEADAVRAFFDRSDALFFGGPTGGGTAGGRQASEVGGADGHDIAWLAALARRLAVLERQGGR